MRLALGVTLICTCGIAIAPDLRYTHWATGTGVRAGAHPNQLEFLASFTFYF
jgi:hypothetical protein